MLAVARAIPEAEIATRSDVDRLDVRPGKGNPKVRAQDRWEIQIDADTRAALPVAYRRSDLIESASAIACSLTRFLVVVASLTATTASALGDWQPLPTGGVTRIAFGSCAKQWERQPIWSTVLEADPDLFLFIGDAIYGDWHGDKPFVPTERTLRADWKSLRDKPEFATVRQRIPFMATWDNHDYGTYNGGAEFPLKEMTRRQFLDFFGEPRNSPRRSRPGIYDARIFGPEGRRVQVILLDTRWSRGSFKKDPRSREERKAQGKVGPYLPNYDEEASVLGEEQWQWLAQELRKSAKVRFIVSSTQIVADEKGLDEWGVFPKERQRLFDLIRQTAAKGVLLLSGNAHFAEISRWDGGNYPLYDFTASGMTHVNPDYADALNSHRVAGPFVEHNVGLVEVDWQARPSPVIRMQALGVHGRVGFEHEVALEALR